MNAVKLEVTPAPTPSQQAVAKAAETVTVADARGRVIVLKKPNVLASLRLIEALGPTAQNDKYVSMVLPLLFVTTVDGEGYPLSTKREVEALYQSLGEDGLTAVISKIQEVFGGADIETDKANLKK